MIKCDYCPKNETCVIFDSKTEEFIKINNSAFDAVIDTRMFIDKCVNTCIFKKKGDKNVNITNS